MDGMNKQTSSFELARFNKSGSALSPITTNSANGLSFTSRRLIQSRSTSTPLTRTSPWQKNGLSASPIRSPVITPNPGYSLSSSVSPKLNSSDSLNRPIIQTVTGPLLASTRFNINLGTYTDTKSPGLTSRLVQYHNELSGTQTSTHQTKYGSPGQFPIVQLYKKELPTLVRTSRRCTVRIAPPETITYNSDQANAVLRDSFVQNNVESLKTVQEDSEINTRSVLEALKEISRKRIHTSEVEEDITKRQRKDSTTTQDNLNKDGKRMREDTPPKPKDSLNVSSSTTTNVPAKKICYVNEIESSFSSSRLFRLQQAQGQKRKSTLKAQDKKKQRKISNQVLVSRETQTPDSNGNIQQKESATVNQIRNKNDSSIEKVSKSAQTDPNKKDFLHDDVQKIMESARKRSKKNSESKTISEIDEENSSVPFTKPKTTVTRLIFDDERLETMKKNKFATLISAFSGQNQEIIPLPEITLTSLKKKDEQLALESSNSERSENHKEVVSILSPKNKLKHNKHVTFSLPDATTNDTPDFPIEVTSSSLPTITKENNFKLPQIVESSPSNFVSFGAVTTTTVATNIISSSVENKETVSLGEAKKSENLLNSTSTPPAINFGTGSNVLGINFNAGSSALSFPASTVSPKSLSTTTISNLFSPQSLNNNLSTVSSSPVVTTPNNAGSKVASAVTSASSLTNFGILSNNPVSVSSNILNPSPNKPALDSSFKFGNTDKSKLTGSSYPGFKFDFGKSPVAVSKSEQAKTSSFGAISNTNTSTAFTPTTTVDSTTIAFGTNVGGFGGTTNTSAFGVPNAIANTTGISNKPIPTENPVPAFGVSTTSSTASSTPAGIFGNTSSIGAGSVFGSPNTSATTAGLFGNTNTNTTTSSGPVSVFGASSTTSGSGVSLFGGVPSTTTNSGTPIFGVSTTTANSGTPAFGASTTTANSGTPVFGVSTTTVSSGTPTFGASTTTASSGTPVFGVSTTTTSSGTPVFGVSTTIANSGASVFGVPSTTAGSGTALFGSPITTKNTSVFGVPSTTTTSNVFGTLNNSNNATSAAATSPIFGTPNTTITPVAFGNPVTNSSAISFGNTATTTASTANVFGSPNNNVFGNTSSTPAFGTNKTDALPSFGAFSATSVTQSSGFGNFNTPVTTQSSAFEGFGVTPATTTNSFTFGATNTVTKPFAFGAATTTTTTASTNLFGGNTFGSPVTTSQSTFGQAANVFANSSSTFGNTTVTPVPVFGASNNNNNSFAANTASNVFGSGTQVANNFGSGSSTQGNVFGSNTNSPSTFGSPSNTSFVSGFTNNNPQPAPAFGGSTTTQAPAQSGVFSFGAPANTTSGTTSNAFQFNSTMQLPKTGGFNFSAGSNTANTSFGSGATSFNPTPPPSFGNGVQNQFNAPAAGIFNIGSGSTAPKQRPMIKARRRN